MSFSRFTIKDYVVIKKAWVSNFPIRRSRTSPRNRYSFSTPVAH